MSDFIPIYGNASHVACWFSIWRLIRENPEKCFLWTLTFRDVLPSHYAANCHRNLIRDIRDAERSGRWPSTWGGVKVPEFHPGGHGVHFHWVISPRIPIELLLQLGQKNGFGRIHVHPDPCTERAATYVAKYLQKGGGVPGLRWSCIGHWEGTKVRDVEMQSPGVNVFRTAFAEAKAAGLSHGACWVHARKTQRLYEHNQDDRDNNTGVQ